MANDHYIEFQKSRDFGSIIGDTIDFIIKNIKSISKNMLVFIIPSLLIMIIWTKFFGLDFFKIQTYNAGGLPANFWLMYALYMIFWGLFSVLMVCVKFGYIKLYIDKKNPITIADVWASVRENFFRVFFNIIGLIFAAGIACGILALVFVLFGILISKTVAAVIGFIIFGIALMYFAIALWPVLFIMVFEKKNIFISIGRSVNLVFGKWWLTFLIIFVVSFVWMLFLIIPSIPYYILIFFISFHGIESTGGVIQILFIVSISIVIFCGALMSMIPSVAVAMHYFNLKERKEASSLFNKIDNI